MLKGVNIIRASIRNGVVMIDGEVRIGGARYGTDYTFSATVGYTVHQDSGVPISCHMPLDPHSLDCSFFFTGMRGIPKDWRNEDTQRPASNIFFMLVDGQLPELHAQYLAEKAV
jgi:hypothetical protein